MNYIQIESVHMKTQYVQKEDIERFGYDEESGAAFVEIRVGTYDKPARRTIWVSPNCIVDLEKRLT